MPTFRTDQQLRSALTRTVPAEAFSADAARQLAGRPEPDAAARAFAARTTAVVGEPVARAGASTASSFWSDGRAGHVAPEPAFAGDGLAERLIRAGLPPLGERRRYLLNGVLGVGATGRVYALVDRDLDRPVAVKVLLPDADDPGQVASFVDEARITASLAHPNVLPVHDLGVDETGQVFFTMKQVDGRSLADAIDTSNAGRRAAPLDDPNTLVNVFIDVCQALSYAHHRRVVHQDVKPANIMLGAFGEVLLVDWGSAKRLDGDAAAKIYGTPLYMSPEQARRERVDERSDVYCVGATLFHALTLRVPTWDDDAERFFALKREGAITPPDDAERAAVPAALLDIALKAMAPRAEDRYPDAEGLLADLRAYQGGLAVRAHLDSLRERLARWHRRHARAIWSTAAAIAVVAGLVAMLAGERLKQMATWGAPVVHETFDDDSWTTRWKTISGSYQRSGGRLVSGGGADSIILLDRRFTGPVAIEYEAESLPDHPLSDLSAIWCRDVKRRADGSISELVEPYYLQFGAQGGAYTSISTTGGRRLACAEIHPVPGRRYHVRAEIADDRMSIAIDGVPACDWTEPIRFDGGYIGFYSYFPGKAYDDVRVWERGEAQRVPATAIGDAFLRNRQNDLAAQLYARVAASQPGTAIAEEALYKQGLCRWLERRYDDAERDWLPLAHGPREPALRLHRIERLFAQRDHDRVIAETAALWALGDPTIRRGLVARWGQCVSELLEKRLVEPLPRYLAIQDRLFPDEKLVDSPAANALLALDRPREVLARHPRQRDECCRALIRLGRWPEIIDGYPDQVWLRAEALVETGRSDEIDPVIAPGTYVEGLYERGRDVDVRLRFGNWGWSQIRALCRIGRTDIAQGIPDAPERAPLERYRAMILAGREDVALDAPTRDICAEALLARGDAAAAWTVAYDDRSMRGRAAMRLGLDAWAAGRREEAARWFAAAVDPTGRDDRLRFARELLVPFLAATGGGDWTAFDAACAAIVAGPRWPQQQRPWHDAAYLSGAIDEAGFLAQPNRAFAEARLLVRRAMRAERAGQRAAALADYRAYLALPRWERWWIIDAPLDAFAAMRAEALAR